MRSRAALALLIVFLTVVAGVVIGTSAARADAPNPPVSADFLAPMCEGTTQWDPTDADGPISDLRLVFGQRLVDYNNGQLVHLYGSRGENGGNPSCTVRYVDGAGPVVEWAYCTDQESKTCSSTDADGALSGDHPGLEDLAGNARLTEEQERLIAYIVRHDIPVGATESSNATTDTRAVRQNLVWCISDPAWAQVGLCDVYMDDAEQQRILALTSAESELAFAADSEPLLVGETAEIAVTTNVYNQPIPIDTDGAAVTVCDGDATLADGALTVDGADASNSVTITLCVTAAEPGSVTVSGSITPTSREHIRWTQSAPGCQVFAAFETARALPVRASASVQFRAADAALGGFSVTKVVEGAASASVPDHTVFTVEYTVGDGAAQELSVAADGTPVSVGGLTEGDVVTLSEVDLPTIVGVTWGAPVFEVDGVAADTVTIGADQTIEVVLTNTASTTPVTPGEPEEPGTPGTPAEPGTPGTPGTSVEPGQESGGALATTGGTITWGALALGGLLLIVGAGAYGLRRRTT